MLQTVNKRIATKPFVTTSVVVRTNKDNLTEIQNKRLLTELEVAFPTIDSEYLPGDIIVVRGDITSHPWAKEIFQEEDQKFILIPYEVVVGVKKGPRAPTPAGWSSLATESK